MGAAGGMNMVIARIPARFSGIDPSLQLKAGVHRLLGHLHLTALRPVFGTARAIDGIFAGRERERFAIGTINLRLERQIGRQSLSLRRVDPAPCIADLKRGRHRFSIGIAYMQGHFGGGSRGE